MRYFGVRGFRVETAGQSNRATGGSLVNLIGIVDTHGFRKAVLDQRDRLQGMTVAGPAPVLASEPTDDRLIETVAEIRDALHRIETKLESSNG